MIKYLLLEIIIAVICSIIAYAKGRSPVEWFLNGLFFSIFGLIIIAALPTVKKCPKCEEIVPEDAQKCRSCGYEFPPETRVETIQMTRETFKKCPRCEAEVPPILLECRFCGYKFGSQ